MTTIYLIRHAEAEGNLYRRIQGHWNGQVTPRGQQQIDALAERFRDVPIDAVWSSDLQRTKDTAGAILKYHDLQLETTPRLREANLGVWEGRPWGDVQSGTSRSANTSRRCRRACAPFSRRSPRVMTGRPSPS